MNQHLNEINNSSQNLLFKLLDNIAKKQQEKMEKGYMKPWYPMTLEENFSWKMQIEQNLKEMQCTTMNLLTAEHIEMNEENPISLEERINTFKRLQHEVDQDIKINGSTEAKLNWLKQLKNTKHMYELQKSRDKIYEKTYHDISKKINNNLEEINNNNLNEIKKNNIKKLDERIKELDNEIAKYQEESKSLNLQKTAKENKNTQQPPLKKNFNSSLMPENPEQSKESGLPKDQELSIERAAYTDFREELANQKNELNGSADIK